MATTVETRFFDAMQQSTDLSKANDTKYTLLPTGGSPDSVTVTGQSPGMQIFPGSTVQYTIGTTPRIQSASGTFTQLKVETDTGAGFAPHATIDLTTTVNASGTDIDITQAQVSFTESGPAVMANVNYTSNADPGTVTMEGLNAGYITQHQITNAEYQMSGSTIQGISGGTTTTTNTQNTTYTVDGARLRVPTTSAGAGTATVATGGITPTTVQWQDQAELAVTKYEITTT